MYENTYPSKRFEHTLEFVGQYLTSSDVILDLGVVNPLSKLLEKQGYEIYNTEGEDLDLDFTALQNDQYTVLTAFEIFEHLLNPFGVLQNCRAKKLLISVPLRLWFSTAYRSKTDARDRHYHEFEAWQLDWLIEKSGYRIIARKKWAHPVKKLGFRPILRWFTPRYYMIYAEKIE